MVLGRANAMRSSFAKLRLARQPRRVPLTRFNRPARRGYASEHGGGHDGGVKSDLPWLVSAVAVTVPATYLILANGDTSSSHKEVGSEYHGDGGDHDEDSGDDEGGDGGDDGENGDGEGKDGDGEGEEGDSGEEKSNEGEEKAEAKSDNKGDEKSKGGSAGDGENGGGESGSDDQQKQQQEDKSDDKSESQDSNEEQGENKGEQGSNDKKRDPMGASRRKIENPNAKAVSGAEEGGGSMKSQQKGLSNTETKHSYNVNEMKGSKKGEGIAETAKVQGTVNPGRRQWQVRIPALATA